MDVSAYSLVAMAQRAQPLLKEGSGMLALSYLAAERVVPHYNMMGVAKAALEASVRFLAFDLGPQGVRVNAISAGPLRTVAARSNSGFGSMFETAGKLSMLKRNITQDEVAGGCPGAPNRRARRRRHGGDRVCRRRVQCDGDVFRAEVALESVDKQFKKKTDLARGRCSQLFVLAFTCAYFVVYK